MEAVLGQLATHLAHWTDREQGQGCYLSSLAPVVVPATPLLAAFLRGEALAEGVVGEAGHGEVGPVQAPALAGQPGPQAGAGAGAGTLAWACCTDRLGPEMVVTQTFTNC